MQLHLKITGILMVLLALSHIFFPRYFKWKADLCQVSVINRQMMYIHTLFIALIVFLIGLLCLSSSTQLVTTGLGRNISLGLGIFCFARLVTQFFGYSPILWKGKPFETTIHIAFALFWTYASGIFLMIYFNPLD